jgi:hypothetical protein
MSLSKCQETTRNPGMDYLYSPFPLLAVMSKTRTLQTVRDGLTDCPRLNSNAKNAKTIVVRVTRCSRRTVRQDPADRPPGPPELHMILYVSKLISDRPPWTCGPSARKRYFLKKLCQTPQILNKLQRPTDRPP